ncbi:MAG TPA: HIT domain-containing protein [Chloroflexota bacterium]|nr:HIT domain-containing protein [Chloroflexota bacterium]
MAFTSPMDLLWTPWRRAFIEGASGDAETACFLCTTSAAHDDRPNLILLRDERAFVIMNRYPYNSGHLMIAPYAHTGDLPGLDRSTAQQLMTLTQRCVGVLQQAYQPQGFNVGMNLGKAAGAGVPDHVHLHVVPRWVGDTNFMPVVGHAKVLPETLDQTYDRLAPLF